MATDQAIAALHGQDLDTNDLMLEMTTLAANEAASVMTEVLEKGLGVRLSDDQRGELVARLQDAAELAAWRWAGSQG